MNEKTLSPYLFGIWVVFGIISFIIFFLGKNAKLKRKLFAPFVFIESPVFDIYLIHPSK